MRGPGRLANETFAVGLLRRMVETPSPSYEEAALAEFLVDIMTEFGFDAYIDEAGNAIGEIECGAGPTVMLLGHMDTTPGVIPVRSDAGRLYGRGAADAKGPLAAMICAAAETTDFAGRIVLVGTVEEETPDSRGALAILREHGPPDALVIGEPGGWSSVVLGCPPDPDANAGGLTAIGPAAADQLERRDPVVRALSYGIRQRRGRPAVKVRTATSDVSTVASVWPTVPTATYGPGDGKFDHSDYEHINLADYVRAICVLRTAIEELGRGLDACSTSAPLRLVEPKRD
jgi:acetylornithine deacetylase/succinyl-diaminopimelate desuccinylase-like protein